MKWLMFVFCVFAFVLGGMTGAVSAAPAQDAHEYKQEGAANKLWVSRQYQDHGDRVLFIEDLETGTRCYAVTNSKVNVAGYAISCVKR
jgi:hypothetical protein